MKPINYVKKIRENFHIDWKFEPGLKTFRVFDLEWFRLDVPEWLNVLEQMKFQEVEFEFLGVAGTAVTYVFSGDNKVRIRYYYDFSIKEMDYVNGTENHREMQKFLASFLTKENLNEQAKKTLKTYNHDDMPVIRVFIQEYLKVKMIDRLQKVFRNHHTIFRVKYTQGNEFEDYEVEGQLADLAYAIKIREREGTGAEFKFATFKHFDDEKVCHHLFQPIQPKFEEIGFSLSPNFAFKIMERILMEEIRAYYQKTKEYKLKNLFS